MNITLLFQATAPIPLHAIAAMAALVIGGLQFALPKGTTPHRLLGYIWVSLMLVVAISSFFIHEIRLVGIFSPIHLLSILIITSIAASIYAAKTGNIRRHKTIIVWVYLTGLLITGAFTLLPTRLMHTVMFG